MWMKNTRNLMRWTAPAAGKKCRGKANLSLREDMHKHCDGFFKKCQIGLDRLPYLLNLVHQEEDRKTLPGDKGSPEELCDQ